MLTDPITKPNRVFSDLNLLFLPHPITSDVVMNVDDAAIKRSLRHIVLSRPFDSPFHPEMSCQANNMLFELATPVTAEIIKATVIQAINKYEPRVTNLLVLVKDNSYRNAYTVEIYFSVIGNTKQITFSVLLNRTR